MSRAASCFLLLLACALPAQALAAPMLTLGVYAYRPPDVMQRRFQPLADYLSAQVPGIQVELTALPLDLLEDAVAEGQVDIVLTNPRHYMRLRSRNRLTGVIATLVKRSFDGSGTRSLGGVIFTRADRADIETLADLGPQRIAVPNLGHTGGYLLQLVELDEAGLPLPKPTQLDISGTHDAVVERVLSGTSDVGFVRTEILEELAASGKLDLSLVKLINQQRLGDYPFMSSTRLYPEWPVVALPSVDERTVRSLMSALYALDPDGPVARSAHIAGFAPPADYLPLEQALRRLQLSPFDLEPRYGLADLWADYKLAIIAGACALGAILALSLILFHRNRALGVSAARLRSLTHLQQALAEQTATLMRVSAADQDRAVDQLLETAARVIDADRAYLFQLDDDGRHLSNTHEWCAEGIAPQLPSLQHIPLSQTQWWWDRLAAEGRVVIDDVASLPDDIAELREMLQAQRIRALFAIALLKDATNRGFVGFDRVRAGRVWHGDDILPFDAAISALGHALLRWRAEAQLRLRVRCDAALLELPRLAEGLDEADFMQRALDLAEDVTGSEIAFLHFVADDQQTIELAYWSHRTLKQFCRARHTSHYPVREAGVWANALRQRVPIIVNDYSEEPGKGGLPEGHAELRRFLTVPVIEDDRVVMLCGVGNKSPAYDASDMETLQLIANEVWRLQQRRRALTALRESEARFLATFEQAAVGIAQVGLDGRWLRVNRKLCDIVGYGSAELLETTFQDITHPEDLDKDLEQLGRMLAREIDAYSMEKRYFRRDGEVVWINLTVALTLKDDGSPDYFISVIEDIQARKQAEEMLVKLAQAVEQTPEAILITNLQAEIEYVNPAFMKTTGYGRDEVIGRNPRILKSGKTPPATYGELWRSLKEGRTWQGELINSRKDGSELIEHAIITPLRQSDGAISHYVAVKEDITERQRLAAELDRHRHHLEELVEARTSELAQARRAAEAANVAKSAFLANMSHEIRTPMNAIVGMTHLLQRNARPDQKGRLDIISDSATHLLSLINGILDLSKIEAGKLVLDEVDFQLSGVFEHLCSLIGAQAKEKGLAFETDRDGVPDWLRGDPLRLRQALLNLAANAVKFTERGKVSIRAAVVEEGARGMRIRFTVEDTGIGISPADQARLFRSFEQLDASINRQYGGTGLGLAISRHLAEQMGGSLELESQVGVGSAFHLEACLGRGRGVCPERDPGVIGQFEPRPRYHGERILLVEDNAINREVASELLYGAGLEVDTAADGEEAVRKTAQNDYDLILMDMQMPVMDGLCATRAVRQLPDRSGLPILAMTANVFEEDRRACLAAGMNDFVSKPVDPNVLFATLSRWIRPRPAEDRSDGDAVRRGQAAPALALPRALERFDTPDLEQALVILGGDVPRFLRMLRGLSNRHGRDAEAIAERLAAGDMAQARGIAHRLKGAAGSLGLSVLRGAATELDAALRRNDAPERLSVHRDAIADELRAIADALSHVSDLDFETDSGVTEEGPSEPLLDELETLLEQDDTRAQIVLLHHQGHLAEVLGPDRARALAGAIEVFDYPEALAMLRNARGAARSVTD